MGLEFTGAHRQPARRRRVSAVIGREAWLFADTPSGVTASARLYSLVETAKANGVDPSRSLE